jgi:hypothetical protein
MSAVAADQATRVWSVMLRPTEQPPETMAVARSLIEDEVADAGAWMPEQVLDPKRFFSRLASAGLNICDL